MAEELLGELPIDIHGGGIDLIFPHHENEIAQAEGATKRQFSRFWMHVEHLMIEEESNGPRRCRSLSATSTTSKTSSRRVSGRRRCAICISARTTASS